MLTPEQIAALRDAFGQIADPINDFLLADIARRISQAGQLTSTAQYQIWRSQQLGLSQQEIKQRLRKMLGKSQKEINELLTQAAEVGYRFDLDRLPSSAAIPFEQNMAIQQVVSAAVKLAQDDFTNLTQTLGMVGPDGVALPLQAAYRKCMDYAFEQVFTGAADYNTAIRRATKHLADMGVRVIDYESGVHTGLEAAVRRNMMGGLGLMQEQITQSNHDDLGADGWEISAHAASAPDHEPIQGRQYSDTEYQALNNSLVRRIGTLNCGHAAFPIILGVSSPQYTPEQLRKFREDNEKGVTYQGRHYTMYEATQMQRKVERAIRRQKNRILVDEATGDAEKLTVDQIRLNRLNEEYKLFSKATGLPTQRERIQVAGFGRGQAARARVAKAAQPAILDEEEKRAVLDYIGPASYGLNDKLRQGLPLEEAESRWVQKLDVALQKLPVVKGEVVRDMVFDDRRLFAEFAKRYAVGETPAEPFYVSATTMGSYHSSPSVRMYIQSKSARDMRAYNAAEGEVLFLRGTKFQVLEAEMQDGVIVLRAEEV